MAGLCAALTALEAGARVVTVEKGTRFGGTMRISSGLIWTFREMRQLREEVPGGDEALHQLVVEGLADGHDWLAGHGVELGPERDFMWYGRGRPSDPPQMTQALVERVAALGGELRLGTAMGSLVESGGEVGGIVLDGPDGRSEFEAGAVVLATGGFQGNAELLARYVTPHAGRLYLRANPWSTGDGLLAATAAGAATTPNLHEFYGHALAAPPLAFSQAEFQDMGQRYGPVAVALNLDGERFTDESAGTGEEHLNQQIALQRDAAAVYIVDATRIDESYYGSPTARSRIERLRARGGTLAESATLEELCDAMAGWGVAPDAALGTLHRYNEAVKQGTAERLSPPRLRSRFPVEVPPFYAVPVRPGITFTAGGLQVDTSMRVLRRSSSVSTLPLLSTEPSELTTGSIAGLYSAGCDAGGFSAHGYMGGLSTALVTGPIAGREAAGSVHARSHEGTGGRDT
jgi:succinate dehydrogenase/fumarate reductase flavoprotein subunit